MKGRYAIIDVETTGLSAKKCRIIEVALLQLNGTEVVDRFQSLINPCCPVNSRITQITGIDESMLRSAPRFEQVAKKLVELTEERSFVAHNASFDYGFFKEEFHSLGYEFKRPKLCTVQLARKAFPGLPSYSLGKLCCSLGISLRNAHRAMADVEATLELFKKIQVAQSQQALENADSSTSMTPRY